MVWLVNWCSVSLSPTAVDSLRMVTSAKVLIEDGAIGTVEGVLFTIGVAEMVDLKW